MLTFHCSRCGRALGVREEFAGRKARCQGCGGINDVPSPGEDGAGLSRPVSPAPGRSVWQGLLAPPRGPEEIGRLGRYRVFRVLGVGRTAVVFEAVDDPLQRPVALKALLPELAASPGGRDRFLREARAMASLDHPNIVPLFDVG